MKTAHAGREPELTIPGLLTRPVDVVPTVRYKPPPGTMASAPLLLIDLETRKGIDGRSYARCNTRLAVR